MTSDQWVAGVFGFRAKVGCALLSALTLGSCAKPPPEPDPPPAEAESDITAQEPAAEPTPQEPDAPDAPATTDRLTGAPPVPEPLIPSPVRICAGGDLLIGNNLDTLWVEGASARLGRRVPAFPDPESLLAPLRPLVDDADIVLINVEGAIGESDDAPSKCRPGSTRCYAFRQPVSVASALGRFAAPAHVVGNVANNHALDAGAAGFQETIEHLRAANVHVTGTDTLATAIALSDADTVAVIGFSVFRAGPDAHDARAVRRHVARAFARYGRVIVTTHIGAEGREAQRTPNATEMFAGEDRGNSVEFARTAIEAGASVVFGHGPHVLRAAMWQGDALVFYSLGNLLTYGPFNMREPNARGAIACVLLDPAGRVTEAGLRPTRQQPPGIVGPDLTGRALQLVDSLAALDFPAGGARVLDDGSVVRRSDQ